MAELFLTATQVATMQAPASGSLQSALQHGPNQIFAVGTDLYYVMLAQLGTVPTNDTNVYKSVDKTTWALVAQFIGTPLNPQTNGYTDPVSVLVGDKIYIVTTSADTPGPTNQIVFQIFQTGADIFLTPSTPSEDKGIFGLNQLISATALNDGTILVSVTRTSAVVFQVQIYDPALDSWGVAVTAVADNSKVIQQIHDPITDLTFVFYQKTTTAELRCLTVTPALTFTDVTVVTLPLFHSMQFGLPIITTDTNEVVIPYRLIDSAPPVLMMARAGIAATPTFTNELVDDMSGLPPGSTLQAFDQFDGPGWAAMDIGGLLYAFYTVDNGISPQDGSTQTALYYRFSSAPGVWSAPFIAYTTVVPGAQLTPYGTNIPGFDPIILVSVIDPTLFPSIDSLTQFILFPLAAPTILFRARPGGGGHFVCPPPGCDYRLQMARDYKRQTKKHPLTFREGAAILMYRRKRGLP